MFKGSLFKFFSKKDKHLYCKYLCDSLIFNYKNQVNLCPISDIAIIKDNFNGIWFDVDELQNKRKELYQKISSIDSLKSCKNCKFITSNVEEFSYSLKSLYLDLWKNCYLNCTYCNNPKEEDLVIAKHYDVYNTILQLFDSGVITKDTKIVFNCGDATIHPEFDKILYYLINNDMKNIEIHTPALRYCESISDAIAKNIATVFVSIDSACPYIYEKVKSVNKYDITIANTKRYLEFQEPSQTRVVLTYTLVNGVNDNQKEILDWYILAKGLGIKKLMLDISDVWFNQVKDNPPQYLKELISFVQKISDYNCYPILFSDKVDIIYKSIN